MKLIGMTDFVLEQNKILNKYINYDKGGLFEIIIYYANFLKQPLELWMFVPCDENGNVLEEKMIFASDDKDYIFESKKFDKYLQAKERCFFVWQDGFDYKGICEMFTDLEDIIDFEFELTKTAKKLIGL